MTTLTEARTKLPTGTPKTRAGRPGVTRSGAWVLSVSTLGLVTASSITGLLVDGLYRDADPLVAVLRGYDLATLVVAAPVLAASLLPALRGSPRATLVRAAMLSYVAYDYAYYVFGTSFNDLFLLHVAVFSTSLFALGFTVAAIDVPAVAGRTLGRAGVRWVAGVLGLLGVSLAAMWISGSLRYAFTGSLPDDGNRLVSTVEMTHLGYVLDLAFLVPLYLLAAVLLWRRRPWGYLLAFIMLLGGTVIQLSYMTALAFQASATIPGATAFDPVEPFILALYALGTAALLAPSRGSARSQIPPDTARASSTRPR